MTKRNSTTRGVDNLGVKAKGLLNRLRDGSEGLVDLEDGDVGDGEAGTLQGERDREGRGEGEVDGVGGGIGIGDDTGENSVLVGTELLGNLAGANNDGGSTIGEGRGVGGGDGTAFLLEGGAESADLVGVDGLVLLILLNDYVALLADDGVRLDLLLENTVLPGLLRTAVRLKRIVVLHLAGDVELLRGVLGAVAHMDLVVDVPETVLDETVVDLEVAEGREVAGGVEGDIRHALHTTRNLDLGNAELDVLRGHGDGLETGSADLVHGGGLDGLGKAGSDDDLAGRSLPNGALKDVAEIEVLNAVGGDAGAGEGRLHDVGTELGRLDVLETAIELGDIREVLK